MILLFLQVLVPKEPSLLGKTFQVDIITTGKHFMKGGVVTESLVGSVPRPSPLPPGTVSGVQPLPPGDGTISGVQPLPLSNGSGLGAKERPTFLGNVDSRLLVLAATLLLVALLVRMFYHIT